jgi:hypothetical protein
VLARYTSVEIFKNLHCSSFCWISQIFVPVLNKNAEVTGISNTSARERRDANTLVIAGVIFSDKKEKQEKLLYLYHHGRRVSSHNMNITIMLSEARRHQHSIIRHRAIKL